MATVPFVSRLFIFDNTRTMHSFSLLNKIIQIKLHNDLSIFNSSRIKIQYSSQWALSKPKKSQIVCQNKDPNVTRIGRNAGHIPHFLSRWGLNSLEAYNNTIGWSGLEGLPWQQLRREYFLDCLQTLQGVLCGRVVFWECKGEYVQAI